jgi:hypothetical protein
MMVYQFYGLNLISNYPFVGELNIRGDALDMDELSSPVCFACDDLPPFPVNWEEGKVVYSQKYCNIDGEAWDKLYHFYSYDVFRFAWGADFYLGSDRIDCHLHNSSYRSWVELYLLGAVLAFWLERQGFPALHASAVVVDGRIAAFPSHSGNGKSTLAAAFLQSDAALLTDDILPIEGQGERFWGRPGLPQINLWPDEAANFTDDSVKIDAMFPSPPKRHIPVEAVRNGTFCPEKRPLACIYIPRKSEGPSSGTDIVITPVSPAEAVIELVRYSFISSAIFESLGWQGRRLDFFSRLVKQVPVRRLLYPAGFDHLPRVTEAVLQDLKNLPSQP